MATQIASMRQTQIEELTRQLRRELEWIPLKAMRKDRTQRYRAASELADDIDNYLNGRPLLAGPESRVYRAKKWAARYRIPLLASAAAFIIVVAGATAYLRGIKREQRRTASALEEVRKQKAEADTQRATAERREAESDAVVHFFNLHVLGNATPEAIPDKSVRDTIVRTMLDPAVKAVREQFKDQPYVEAKVMNQIALVYDKLGRLTDAEPLYRDALERCRRVLGEDHPNTLSTANNYAGVLMQLGRPTEAEPLCRDTMLRRRRVLGADDPATLLSTDNYARLLQSLKRSGEAEPLVRDVLDRRRVVLGEDHPATVRSLSTYATVLRDLSRFREAEPLAREAFERFKRLLGEDHPDTLESLNDYAGVLRLLNRPAEAEPLSREAMERSRRVLGSDHPMAIRLTLDHARVLQALGRPAEAEPLFREVLEARRRLLGPDHPRTIMALHHVASILNVLGRASEAEPLEREALRRTLAHPELGASSEFTRTFATRLAEILDALNRREEADALRTEYARPATVPAQGN
jgi:tetratricopeptide (TPR) repeat protein